MAKISKAHWEELSILRKELIREVDTVFTYHGKILSPSIREKIAQYVGTTFAHLRMTPSTKEGIQADFRQQARAVGEHLVKGASFEEAVSTSDTRFCLAKE